MRTPRAPEAIDRPSGWRVLCLCLADVDERVRGARRDPVAIVPNSSRSPIMRRLSAIGAVLLLAVTAATTQAQTTTGTIAGRIVDTQGLAMPGVTVTATGPQGAKTAVTDADGRFNMPFLTPGAYALRAELQGFKTVEQTNLQVRLDQRVDVPLTMEIGTVTESVTVVGSLGAGAVAISG